MMVLTVIDKRPDAAGEAQNARAAFALDLLGGKTKRGNTAIDGKAVAGGGAIERGGDAKDLPMRLGELMMLMDEFPRMFEIVEPKRVAVS